MDCGIWSSIIGGLIAGILAIAAVFLTLQGQRQHDNDRQQEIIRGVLQAIYEELNEIYNQLNSLPVIACWEDLTSGEFDYYRHVFPISQDYPIIYRSNANLIGQIKNSNLRREIVKIYKSLDVLMETYQLNNRLINEYEETKNTGTAKLILSVHRQLMAVAPRLLYTQDLFKKSVKKLLDMLKKELT